MGGYSRSQMSTCGPLRPVAAAVMPLAFALSGGSGVIAATIAAAICLVGGEAALLLSGLLARRLDALRAVLIGMMVRMGVPLVLGLVAHLLAPSLTVSGMFFYFLPFYAMVLVVETMLSVAHGLAPFGLQGNAGHDLADGGGRDRGVILALPGTVDLRRGTDKPADAQPRHRHCLG